ncbi:MAG: S8 family serine peptidase [Candidatus Kapabacteria bacterium]|nr:S8 family serine peptidase [Candidatus Kapabacteria bacterium]
MADRQTGRPADRQTGRPADRQTGKINWYKHTLLFAFLMICSTFIATPQSYGQGWDIRLSDALGNAQVVSWPPHDTTYSPNTVIIKFKRSALRLENLCYTYNFDDNLTNNAKKSESQMGLLTYDQKIYLFSQRFTPHEVTSDSLLANAMLARGIDTLRRLTSANPCKDTISITILGDTVECEDYLYFEASFSNDTSVLSTCFTLSYSFPNSLNFVEPNLYAEPTIVPGDYRYSVQTSFHPQLTDIESVWDDETGSDSIQIGIIDDGIQYDKCEFNRSNVIGNGNKVAYGFNYQSPYNLDEVKRWAWHGTNMASLAAGRTNDQTSQCYDGIAGVAGGWGDDNIGCELYALSVGKFRGPIRYSPLSNFISAILENSSRNPVTGYGNQVDVLNCSWRFGYSQSLKEAVQYAFVNNVSVVASRANDADTNYRYGRNLTNSQNHVSYNQQKDGFLVYPACYEEHVVTCVGAAGERHPTEFNNYSYQKDRVRYSNFGRLLDFIVSTGERRWNPYNPVNDLNRAVLISEIADPVNNVNIGFEQTDGTSATAAITSGIIGLIRSYALNHGFFYDLEPEDYQGILKASAEDRIGNRGYNNHLEDFDIYSGWGHVNAGEAIRMFKDNYRVIKGSTMSVGFGDWEDHPLAAGNPNYKVAFRKETYWNQAQYYNDSKVKVRTVTGQIVLPTNIDYTSPIYTWGVSGRTNATGWSLGNPQMQHGYSVVLPGSYNNSEDDGGHLLTAGHNLIPGIIHHRGGPYSKSGVVDVTTFQYALLDQYDNIIDILPPTGQIGVNLSIFAKVLNTTSVAKGNSDEHHLVYPSIANSFINVQWKEVNTINCQVRIRSLLGEIVQSVEMEPTQTLIPISIDVSKLPIGSYFVEVVNGNKVQSYKIMIVR